MVHQDNATFWLDIYLHEQEGTNVIRNLYVLGSKNSAASTFPNKLSTCFEHSHLPPFPHPTCLVILFINFWPNASEGCTLAKGIQRQQSFFPLLRQEPDPVWFGSLWILCPFSSALSFISSHSYDKYVKKKIIHLYVLQSHKRSEGLQ